MQNIISLSVYIFHETSIFTLQFGYRLKYPDSVIKNEVIYAETTLY